MPDSHAFPISLPRDRMVFRRPRWMVAETPAWIGHIPFAFWLVGVHQPGTFVELGTHYGNSYFAFLEALSDRRVPSSAHAVDTWLGDEHSGLYGEEVFRAVTAHNDAHYAPRSSLVRSTFDEAATHFRDGEIDLLHIDGHHTYDSVKHDVENWLPKLSDQGLLLLHDIAVRERDFGVYAVYDELARDFPAFAFEHSHGLGLVGVGSHLPAPIAALFSLGSEAVDSVRAVFARLGTALAVEAGHEAASAAIRAEEASKRAEAIQEVRNEMEVERTNLERAFAEEREALTAMVRAAEERRLRDTAALEQEIALADQRATARLDRARRTGRNT